MKGNLIALGLKLVGLGSLWDKLDGMKTYLGASAEMLSGLGAMALSAAELLKIFMANVHSLGDAINFVMAVVNHPNPSCIALMAGWALVLHGWGVMAKKHSDDKRHEELTVAPAVELVPAAAPQTPDAPKI